MKSICKQTTTDIILMGAIMNKGQMTESLSYPLYKWFLTPKIIFENKGNKQNKQIRKLKKVR